MSAATPVTATAPAVTPARRRGGAATARRRTAVVGYLFVAPVALGLLWLYIYPALATFVLSFTEWGPFGGNTFNGFANYVAVFSSQTFWRSLLNTFGYMLIGLLVIPVAIVVAALLNKPGLRGVGVYRALYFIPFITLPVASGMVWKWLYNGEYGLINQFLGVFGISGTYWVANPATALVAIGIVQVWSQIGYYLVIFIAGIKGIPAEYSEAAELDGAGSFRRFSHITLPLLSPSIFFCTVINVIATLQIFDLIYVMSQSSSANPAFQASQSIVTLFYEMAFVDNTKGPATALAFILMILIAALTAVQFRLQRRWVQYA
ncbi:binding-protein-dependent transport systems inner membrane component [Beutenbergia cavernae DSM 12333]|uniref:Binding-protein-dependent transport systems inner membrane component n=1 Tax=Beutenbergia cavernae (strain ATCC BAA-8 / DSM 12333 / CCUG 43141 / JCM 11478 / NBRC 16432 / NCIMB 13614 / HKI 0122) TaxID=471853 RepID=C5C3Z9_BEUC1|nr:sugar ABC transporter permease [Beutenbergia cavernae]ACQ79912.1 binding-protein-dependent transport systems inner membrane component [Beutenbergia cavernae DSM 12333]